MKLDLPQFSRCCSWEHNSRQTSTSCRDYL